MPHINGIIRICLFVPVFSPSSVMSSRSIHMVAGANTLFLFGDESYSPVWMDPSGFIHPSVDGFFDSLTVLHNRAINKYLFESLLPKLLGIYLQQQSLDYMLILCLIFERITIVFPSAADPLYILTRNLGGSPFLHELPHPGYFPSF